ncbi:MAG: hypothetical protein JWO10_1738 [Microbacteriaceae bacterium]|nr:hypothetical protein [Microbacteriaceae bacterium]
MKRPEGFDPGSSAPAPAQPRKTARPAARQQPTKAEKPQRAAPAKRAKAGLVTPEREKLRRETPGRMKADPMQPRPTRAKAELRKAARARRRYERVEVRRFTRRSRRRRFGWLGAFIALVVIAGLVTGAVYSPLLSLSTITVTGTSRVDPTKVRAALADQVGTPLALVDFAKIKTRLSKFPLIRSYVTESLPPHTLVIRIDERTPIASLATPSGFSVVDAAGVVIDSGTDRAAGLPIIDLGTATQDSAAFTAAVAVLITLPADLLAKVDRISALTRDDVTLILGGGQRVTWGSPDSSALKARVLAALVAAQGGSSAVTYDVSAPLAPVVGPG